MVVDFLSFPPFLFLKLDFGFRRSFIYWHVRPYPKRWRVSEWFYGCLCRRFRGFTGLRLILCKFLALHLCTAWVIRSHTLLPLRFLKTPASKIHMWFRKLNEFSQLHQRLLIPVPYSVSLILALGISFYCLFW